MLPKSYCMLKAKKLSFIFLEEAFSNSCGAEVLVDDIASKFTKLERRCQLLSIYVKTAKKWTHLWSNIFQVSNKSWPQRLFPTLREPRMPTFMERDMKYRNFDFSGVLLHFIKIKSWIRCWLKPLFICSWCMNMISLMDNHPSFPISRFQNVSLDLNTKIKISVSNTSFKTDSNAIQVTLFLKKRLQTSLRVAFNDFDDRLFLLSSFHNLTCWWFIIQGQFEFQNTSQY